MNGEESYASGNGPEASQQAQPVPDDSGHVQQGPQPPNAKLGKSPATWSDEPGRALRENMAERPYTVVAAAAGVGYILGGGLKASATKVLLKAGVRSLARSVAHELLTPTEHE